MIHDNDRTWRKERGTKLRALTMINLIIFSIKKKKIKSRKKYVSNLISVHTCRLLFGSNRWWGNLDYERRTVAIYGAATQKIKSIWLSLIHAIHWFRAYPIIASKSILNLKMWRKTCSWHDLIYIYIYI